MSMQLGIIGAGTIGEVHARAAHAVGQTVVAVADLELAKAQRLAAAYPGARATNTISDLLDDAAIDAVVIAVPNKWHRPLAVDALRAGKDVLLEKPMALTAAECSEVNRVVADTGRILQIGMVYRFSAAAQAAKSVIDQGDLGEIYHAKAHMIRRRGVPGLGGWFTNKGLSGGGPLIDVGVHMIDLASWLMGFPLADRVSGKVYSYFGRRMADYVYEQMWAGPPQLSGLCDVEDSAHALIRFAGGATLDLQVSWAINMPQANGVGPGFVGIFGDRGGLTFELGGDHVNLAAERHGRNTDTQFQLPDTEPFAEQAKAFGDCVANRHQPSATGAQGQLVLSIIDAIYASSTADQEVKVEET
ncbi:MAG: Gfo/Idh/MocA family oxidoreductase [Pirellulales bacterium]|nr:Gfo/Idh/MocA family oxidoreductase [Pirellulales bacterium]